ncbi:helix-turn-helix transcriptional regulator [Tenacibaculum sp. 190524A05c]|uniref:helix-turn-helix domain-containing protein n=1 Tax=Tenacibaculum platacis TaxID=3137852 RepID=UPI0032B10217
MSTFNLLYFTGVILLFFFVLILITGKKYRSKSNFYLAGTLLTILLLNLKINEQLNYWLLIETLEFFRLEYLFSPLLFLYVTFTLNEVYSKSFLKLLLIPFVVFSLYHGMVSIADWIQLENFEFVIELIEPLEFYVFLVFNVVIQFVLLKKIKKSSASQDTKKWLIIIVLGLFLLLIFLLISEFGEVFLSLDLWDISKSLISVFSIIISYKGVLALQIEEERRKIKKITRVKIQKESESTQENHRIHKMKLIMESEELFKDAKLTRESFAEKLGISSSSVTRILKEQEQISFTDFVNSYRIELAKKMLKDHRFEIFSLEAIGKEVGFKSRSSFYETFKKQVGVSPGKFKKN